MKDLLNSIHPVRAISPASVSDNTAQVGQVIDRQGYNSLTFIALLGALADSDATFTTLLEHGDVANLSDAAPVPDDQLIGTEALASAQFDDDNETRKLGYKGSKRYVRLTITPAGNASAALLGAVAVLGHPDLRPTPNPPV